MDRRSFFAADLNRAELESKSISQRVDDRWLAAVVLGRVLERWAFEALLRLKTDRDVSTRSAAVAALRQFPREFFDIELTDVQPESLSGFVPGVWKLKPLPEYDHEIRDLFLAAVIDLVTVEGSVTGSRIQGMLTKASFIGGGGKVSKGRTRTFLIQLLESNLLTRADAHLSKEDIALWILHRPGTPQYVIRGRRGRELVEIPVNEARAVLQQAPRFNQDNRNRDAALRILIDHYEIKQNEFFLLGEAMANQWQTLFDVV